MPLPQPRTPRSHRARRARRRPGPAAGPAAGRRAFRRPPLLSAAGRSHPAALGAALLAALSALVVSARAGVLTHLWDFLDYGAGVLSLVSLTGAVLWGLAATDRTLLASAHRLAAQGVHRGLAVAGLGFLGLHVWVKVARSRTDAAAAVVPFADGDRPLLIGLGTLAGYLFVAVAVSGAVRSAFATRGRSLWWRALHMGAYPAWGASLVHGLKSGRAAGGWVTAAYALCLVAVAALLAVRLRARLRTQTRSQPRTEPRAATVRPPAGAVPPPRAPEQAPRQPASFVRKPAEWAAELLTARLSRQSGPEVFRPADLAADLPADPPSEPAADRLAGLPAELPADRFADRPFAPLDGVRGRR
ncbi:hypothetical protein SAVIM338S_06167 [Streptomyces avidinii]